MIHRNEHRASDLHRFIPKEFIPRVPDLAIGEDPHRKLRLLLGILILDRDGFQVRRDDPGIGHRQIPPHSELLEQIIDGVERPGSIPRVEAEFVAEIPVVNHGRKPPLAPDQFLPERLTLAPGNGFELLKRGREMVGLPPGKDHMVFRRDNFVAIVLHAIQREPQLFRGIAFAHIDVSFSIGRCLVDDRQHRPGHRLQMVLELGGSRLLAGRGPGRQNDLRLSLSLRDKRDVGTEWSD